MGLLLAAAAVRRSLLRPVEACSCHLGLMRTAVLQAVAAAGQQTFDILAAKAAAAAAVASGSPPPTLPAAVAEADSPAAPAAAAEADTPAVLASCSSPAVVASSWRQEQQLGSIPQVRNLRALLLPEANLQR